MRNPSYILECCAYFHKVFYKHFSVFCVNHCTWYSFYTVKKYVFFLNTVNNMNERERED